MKKQYFEPRDPYYLSDIENSFYILVVVVGLEWGVVGGC
jgi:hypothetical protein